MAQTARVTSSIGLAVASSMLSLLVLAGCVADGASNGEGAADDDAPLEADLGTARYESIRVASFNVRQLSAEKIDTVDAAGRGTHPQLLAAAAVIRQVRPAVLLLNEIDFDAERPLPRLFVDRYLAPPDPLFDTPPIDYPHVVYEPTNTGVPSGFDLDDDGATDGPDDAWGYGEYPGQYGMALLSRLAVDREALRTFQTFLWRDLPGHLMPDGRDGAPAWYEADEAAALRLSSKSHWDVPLRIDGPDGPWTLHVLASHPTPPVFDGPEDRNGRRNSDEIRFWVDYLDAARADAPAEAGAHLVDDGGRRGGLAPGSSFVLVGDLNADPATRSNEHRAIERLVAHPLVSPVVPRTAGTPPPARETYEGDDRARTSEYGRLDYALPSRDLEVVSSGVFLPDDDDPARSLVVGDRAASDHWLVWVDVRRPFRR